MEHTAASQLFSKAAARDDDDAVSVDTVLGSLKRGDALFEIASLEEEKAEKACRALQNLAKSRGGGLGALLQQASSRRGSRSTNGGDEPRRLSLSETVCDAVGLEVPATTWVPEVTEQICSPKNGSPKVQKRVVSSQESAAEVGTISTVETTGGGAAKDPTRCRGWRCPPCNMKIKKCSPFASIISLFRHPDVIAGLTVGVMVVPQSMSYASIAGLGPVYGLYSACVPTAVYAFFGQSRQLAVGPVAMVSLLVEAGLRDKLTEEECPAVSAASSLSPAERCPEAYVGGVETG